MNRILVVANRESDLLNLLKKHCNVTVVRFDSDPPASSDFDALCLLGGSEDRAITLCAPLHNLAYDMYEEGKPVFFEFIEAIFSIRPKGINNTAFQRMVYRAEHLECDGLSDGDLFDGQCNDCIHYRPIQECNKPILTYKQHVCAHSNIEITEEEHRDGIFAGFFYKTF